MGVGSFSDSSLLLLPEARQQGTSTPYSDLQNRRLRARFGHLPAPSLDASSGVSASVLSGIEPGVCLVSNHRADSVSRSGEPTRLPASLYAPVLAA